MGETLNLPAIAEVRREVTIEDLTVDSERLAFYWPSISTELDKVPHTWEQWWTKDALYESATGGLLQVWAVGDSREINLVVFSTVLFYPRQKVLEVFLALGNSVEKCLPLLKATLHKFALSRDCGMVQISNARPGWEKLVPEFRRSAVVLQATVERIGAH